jgi:hypothetical protein
MKCNSHFHLHPSNTILEILTIAKVFKTGNLIRTIKHLIILFFFLGPLLIMEFQRPKPIENTCLMCQPWWLSYNFFHDARSLIKNFLLLFFSHELVRENTKP